MKKSKGCCTLRGQKAVKNVGGKAQMGKGKKK